MYLWNLSPLLLPLAYSPSLSASSLYLKSEPNISMPYDISMTPTQHSSSQESINDFSSGFEIMSAPCLPDTPQCSGTVGKDGWMLCDLYERWGKAIDAVSFAGPARELEKVLENEVV